MQETVLVPELLREPSTGRKPARRPRGDAAGPGAVVPRSLLITSDHRAGIDVVREALATQSRLHGLAQEAGTDVEAVLALLARHGRSSSGQLSAEEAAVLDRAQISLAEDDPGVDVALDGQRAVHALRRSALTVEAAARLLAVTPGRIRQRISDRELVTIQDGTTRLPAWQFRDARVVPGIEALHAHLADLHPLAAQQFMTLAQPDLTPDPAAGPVSPVEWLLGGGPVADVLALLEGPRG